MGMAGQVLLRGATVAVVGAGGLGVPVLTYLAAAGVGHLVVIDHDRIDVSNLQRQVLYTTAQAGMYKALAAAERLTALNPHIRITAVTDTVGVENAMPLLQGADVVVDATDNFPTRYLLNDACVLMGKPLVYGSLYRYEGQVSVFNYQGGPNYRDLYPVPPDPASVPNCATAGVMGALAGIIGSMQANEVIKILSGQQGVLSGKLWVMDAQAMEATRIGIPDRNSKAAITTLINYDHFCGLSPTIQAMKEVTVQELKQLLDSKANIQLIDVREPHEADICEIGGELIPMAQVPDNVARISKDKQVVIHCRSGRRSGDIINWLEKNHGFTNLYNLKGGILAWADQIDPTMDKY